MVIGAIDPNPRHAGRALRILRRGGINVVLLGRSEAGGRHFLIAVSGPTKQPRADDKALGRQIAGECELLNESFNHWIVHRTPFVTVKAAMTLDGKIATKNGESKWVTGEIARSHAMKLRQASDAILVGVNTVLADDPSLASRSPRSEVRGAKEHRLRRIVLDTMARTPLTARLVTDELASLTTVVTSNRAPKARVRALKQRVNVLMAPSSSSALHASRINLGWLLRRLGREGVTSLLVEGGGEVNASFLLGGFARRIAFFYAPTILGGRESRKAVAGEGVEQLSEVVQLQASSWQKFGPDLLLTARVKPNTD